MDDRDFFDTMYQGWAKTTGAENTFWMPEKQDDQWEYDHEACEELKVPGEGFDIFAVDSDQIKTLIGHFQNEEDAAFITAIHGCFGDLVKRLHAALDESDRLDNEKDALVVEMAELAEELAEVTTNL